MPQPHGAVRAAAIGQPLHADLDDRALDDRQAGVQLFGQPGEVTGPLDPLVQAVPGPDLDFLRVSAIAVLLKAMCPRYERKPTTY
jgi:hypothetical protein